ncbi:MAG: carboxypeptidase-like regulatory domain-containing protein, partial [Acidobacteriota bacterium]|nr:carboxypeptidase-like regulatory domain-containing protein [Acidobacteriota bacterium]
MQKTIGLIRLGLTICLGLSFYHASLPAQTANGRVLGTITDPSGAAIADAKVTVINTDTHLPRETPTDKEGSFQVLDLPIGTYSVTAEAAGFNKAVTLGHKLLINQSLRIDLSLEVGSTSNTVQVEGTASAVETVNATLGQSVTSRPIVNLPLNGRNVLDLALL